MRYSYIILVFTLILILNSFSEAQTPSGASNPAKEAIDYQWPADGNTYVPAGTTIIIRPVKDLLRAGQAEDFSFNVHGSRSGIHFGKIHISDDHQTICFLPNQPFALNEKVDVSFTMLPDGILQPVLFSFQITPLSDSDQAYQLGIFGKKEEGEREAFANKNKERGSSQIIQNILIDTLPQFTVDTLVPAKVADGNIFVVANIPAYLEMLDNSGQRLFERRVGPLNGYSFRPWPGNKLTYYRTALSGPIGGKTIMMDSNFNVIDSFDFASSVLGADFHEFQLLPNGHVLVMANEQRDTNMRAITHDSNSTTKARVLGSIIEELDTSKAVVFYWRTWDHFSVLDATDINYTDPNTTFFDYAHLNSIDADTDSNLIASFRAMDLITKINRKTGKVMWRWGGNPDSNYFHEIDGDTVMFNHQHDVRRISNGHLTMFDNGNYRKVFSSGFVHDTTYSRALEYDVDENNLSVRKVWEYTDIPFSSSGGNVQRLPNGNTLIGLGIQNNPNTIEVTPSGEKVYQLSFQGPTFNYRSFRFPFPSPKNSVSKQQMENAVQIASIRPNPASGSATVTFTSSQSGSISLQLTDVVGHSIRSFSMNLPDAGEYSIPLDLSGLANGVYYCKLLAAGGMSIKPVIVVK